MDKWLKISSETKYLQDMIIQKLMSKEKMEELTPYVNYTRQPHYKEKWTPLKQITRCPKRKRKISDEYPK